MPDAKYKNAKCQMPNVKMPNAKCQMSKLLTPAGEQHQLNPDFRDKHTDGGIEYSCSFILYFIHTFPFLL